jgi:guanylate kinase
MSGSLYVISGPSGVGKSTIIRLIRERVTGMGYSISHTSRKPRVSEVNGVDYHFVDRETFGRMIDDSLLVEWAEVYDAFYGTSFSSLRSQTNMGLDVLMDLDSKGAKNIKEHFKDSILIYISPPSLEVLEKRLRDRALDDEVTMKARLEKAVRELGNYTWYDYIVINDDLDKVVREVESIIIAERCSRTQMLPKVKKLFGL